MELFDPSEIQKNKLYNPSDIRGVPNALEPVGLKNFTLYKQQLIDDIIKDDYLTKLLKYPREDFLSQPSLTQQEREDLIFTHIYPTRFINDIKEDRTSLISIEFAHWQPFEGYRIFSDKFIFGYIYFYLLSDINIANTNYGVRQDLMLARIYDIFEGYSKLGVGEMKQETQLPLYPDNSSYGGYTIGFLLTEYK